MFTVLIAEKEHIDAIQQENKLFFEPFLKSKDLAFCEWNPNGQNLYDSVPGLLDAVGRKKDWRAVIIGNATAESIKARNPFDNVDYSEVASLKEPNRILESEALFDKWELSWREYYETLSKAKETVYKNALEKPLQKLTTWLCFKPEDYVLKDVQERQDVQEWAMEQLERDIFKTGVILENLERIQYKHELRVKEELRREFVSENYLNIAYPKEIHCISVRTADGAFFDPDIYWNVRSENEYSAFADRNMYFDKMRFLVFDLLPKTHRNFRTDYIRFLASVLIFVSNSVPPSAMQARRLYQLEVETDDMPLSMLVTSYDKKLLTTSDVIESEMEKIRSEIPGELTDKDAAALFCTPQDIPVLLDSSCDQEKVLAEKDYGLFFDSPEDEYNKWNRDYNASEKALYYIAKQQSRAVKKSIKQMRLLDEVSNVDISRLTPIQIDDIREYTDASENDMVASIPPNLSDVSYYTQQISEESKKVKKVISRRMTMKTTIILSAICLGLFFVCFLPFLFANGSTPKTVTTAILLSGAMVGILAMIMFISMFFLRSSVVNAVKSYNNTARGVLNEIQSALGKVSKYLSASYNVRRGYAVQNYAQKNLDEYTKQLRIRKKHQEDIRKKRAYLFENYSDYFGDMSLCDETMSRPYDYDFDQRTEYEYPAPFLAGDSRQIEFISNGNYVNVPSSYVTRILVKLEELYEK